MDADWHVRIADFGLAILAETTFSDEGSSVPGAVRWMAPELFVGTPQSAETKFGRTKATDVYSFACTCVEVRVFFAPPNWWVLTIFACGCM